MSPDPRLIRSSEVTPVEMSTGVVRRTLGWGERMLLAEVSLAKGCVIPPHSHPHEQVGYVARGRLQLVVGASAPVVLEPGDGYTIPGGVSHSVTALEDAVAVDVFSPVREEYK